MVFDSPVLVSAVTSPFVFQPSFSGKAATPRRLELSAGRVFLDRVVEETQGVDAVNDSLVAEEGPRPWAPPSRSQAEAETRRLDEEERARARALIEHERARIRAAPAMPKVRFVLSPSIDHNQSFDPDATLPMPSQHHTPARAQERSQVMSARPVITPTSLRPAKRPKMTPSQSRPPPSLFRNDEESESIPLHFGGKTELPPDWSAFRGLRPSPGLSRGDEEKITAVVQEVVVTTTAAAAAARSVERKRESVGSFFQGRSPVSIHNMSHVSASPY